MNRWHSIPVTILVIWAMVASTDRAPAASIDELVAAARKEGALKLLAPSSIGPEGAQALIQAFNKKYGFNIKVPYFLSSSFTNDTAKVISQSALGVAPEWDLMVLTEANHADLWRKGILQPFDYKALGVDPRGIQHDNSTIAFIHGRALPAYNTKALAAMDIPKSWDDLLNPKWKDGKLGVSDATYFFTAFATGPWGEKKTTEFVRGLARQRPFLGRLAELSTRLELGEILVAAMLVEPTVHIARMKGAPIAFAEAIDPVIVNASTIGVLKGAAHPNAAHLFTVFMVSQEAQDFWDKYRGNTSAFVPGTKINKSLKDKEVLYQGGQDPALVQRLSNEYSKILGFIR